MLSQISRALVPRSPPQLYTNCTACNACRFGMHAQIGTVREPVLRVEIVSQRQIFDDNPTGFRCEGAGSKEG